MGGTSSTTSGQHQGAQHGRPQDLVVAPEGEHTAPLGAHIEAVENLAHAHGQEGHGHAVGETPGAFQNIPTSMQWPMM